MTELVPQGMAPHWLSTPDRRGLASILGSELLADCERSCAVGLRGTAVQPPVDTALIPLL